MSPWANLKLGIQYTAYTQFNGGNKNYDGFGRNAERQQHAVPVRLDGVLRLGQARVTPANRAPPPAPAA